jgi:hypothetical protein
VDALDDQPPDVHGRYERYVAQIATTSVDGASGLLSTLDSEPDPPMAESALLSLVDHLASSSPPDAFAAWCRASAQILRRRPVTSRRVDEWLALLSFRDGATLDESAVDQTSDWLQLRLAAELSPSQGLAVLVRHGRTRRVRTLATRRLPKT